MIISSEVRLAHGPPPQRAQGDDRDHGQHQHQERTQDAARPDADRTEDRHLRIAVQASHRQQQADHQAQRQHQRQVSDQLQPQLRQHHPGRNATTGDIAEHVGEDAAQADQQQHHQGREGGLAEFTQQITVKPGHLISVRARVRGWLRAGLL
jgi:hypothetical protein